MSVQRGCYDNSIRHPKTPFVDVKVPEWSRLYATAFGKVLWLT